MPSTGTPRSRFTSLTAICASRPWERSFDEAEQIIEPVEPDDEIDAGNFGDFLRIHLRIAARDQHLRRWVSSLGPAHQLARLPIRSIGHRAGIDHITVGDFIKSDERVFIFQAGFESPRNRTG